MQQPNEHYFEQLGENFEAFMDNYDVQQRLALIFDRLLGGVDFSDKQILEIGCGTGRISQKLATLGAILTVSDISSHLVETVSARLHCAGLPADACALPLADNSFDLVISSECIEHTREPIQAIREMARVCKPGGIVCLTTPNRLWYPVLRLSVITGIRKFRGIENWLFPGRASHTLLTAGFERCRMSGCHLWPFQLSWTRPLLRPLDRWSPWLYPVMINFGVMGVKKS